MPKDTVEQILEILGTAQADTTKTASGVSRLCNLLKEINDASDHETISASAADNYLRRQIGSAEGRRDFSVNGLLATWHAAHAKNYQDVCSLVAECLAALLAFFSTRIHFREFGNRICCIVLHVDQQALLRDGLGAHTRKNQAFTCYLTLLYQIILFDGGRNAAFVFDRREVTFHRLDVLLGIKNQQNVLGDKRQTICSTRDIALQYFIANLRLQDTNARTWLLSSTRLTRAVLHHIAQDQPQIIRELLCVLESDVVANHSLAISTKLRFFDTGTLRYLSTLYDISGSFSRNLEETSDEITDIVTLVHDILTTVCTAAWDGGSQRSASSTSQSSFVSAHQKIQFDHDERTGLHCDQVLAFLRSLRPHLNVIHGDLILHCFRCVPFMVVEYFKQKNELHLDSSMLVSLIGHMKFFLGIIRLPIPPTGAFRDCGPTEVVKHMLAHAMPPILDPKFLYRCLNHSSILVRFLATKILSCSLTKLLRISENAINMEEEPLTLDTNGYPLRNACFAAMQSHEGSLRNVCKQFRTSRGSQTTFSEAIARLVVICYRAAPTVAMTEKLDPSAAFVDTSVAAFNVSDQGARILHMHWPTIRHILDIAWHSSETQWCQKSARSPITPLTALLRLHVTIGQGCQDVELKLHTKHILRVVTKEAHIFCAKDDRLALDLLILSLDALPPDAFHDAFEWLDCCIIRSSIKKVEYLESLCTLTGTYEQSSVQMGSGMPLLIMVFIDQWQHMTKTHNTVAIQRARDLLGNYLRGIIDAGCDHALRLQLIDVLSSNKDLHGLCDNLGNPISYGHVSTSMCRNSPCAKLFGKNSQVAETIINYENVTQAEAQQSRHVPPVGQHSKDVPNVLGLSLSHRSESVTMGRIFMDLRSEEFAVRTAALVRMRLIRDELFTGDSAMYSFYLLAGEIMETVEHMQTAQLSNFAISLGEAILCILNDPADPMYAKVNRFLHKYPRWEIAKLPSYWTDQILLQEADTAEQHSKEVHWLLNILSNGLSSEMDLGSYVRSGIFERLLSFYCSTKFSDEVSFAGIVRLLERSVMVDGTSRLTAGVFLENWITQCSIWRSSGEVSQLRSIMNSHISVHGK